ncbi:hypothetical protein RK21_03983 [Pseudomonas plecoglossicida]|nr:hypothetical protein RK21_03983 [Pseudomonas plecoglossicida]
MNPVGAGLPANAAVEPPSHSRVNPLPQAATQARWRGKGYQAS